jgi:hypothetical protein
LRPRADGMPEEAAVASAAGARLSPATQDAYDPVARGQALGQQCEGRALMNYKMWEHRQSAHVHC